MIFSLRTSIKYIHNCASFLFFCCNGSSQVSSIIWLHVTFLWQLLAFFGAMEWTAQLISCDSHWLFHSRLLHSLGKEANRLHHWMLLLPPEDQSSFTLITWQKLWAALAFCGLIKKWHPEVLRSTSILCTFLHHGYYYNLCYMPIRKSGICGLPSVDKHHTTFASNMEIKRYCIENCCRWTWRNFSWEKEDDPKLWGLIFHFPNIPLVQFYYPIWG